MTPRLGAALALVISLTCLVTGCGKDEAGSAPVPGRSATAGASPSPAVPSFSMPLPGDEIGSQVTARPPNEESAQGAALFAAWSLSLLLHTPREEASTELWSEASGEACEPCLQAAAAWKEQVSKGQVFEYAGSPRFVRTEVRAQPQGDDWFVQYAVAVPRGTLKVDGRVLQSARAEQLGYTFKVSRTDTGWRIVDFHVLG